MWKVHPKLHLENETLQAFTAIDPLLVCSLNKLVLKRLLSLLTLVPTVLEDEEENTFQKEVHALRVDGNLPSPLNDEDNEVDCLEWRDKISDWYSVTFKLVCVILPIFHGPRVESTFTVMNNVIDQNSGRMNMGTYGAIQDIKYALKTWKPCKENQSVKVWSGQLFQESFEQFGGLWLRFRPFFSLPTCSNYSITNYVDFPVFQTFKRMNKGQLRMININY